MLPMMHAHNAVYKVYIIGRICSINRACFIPYPVINGSIF